MKEVQSAIQISLKKRKCDVDGRLTIGNVTIILDALLMDEVLN